MFTGIIEETGTVKKIIGQQVSGSIEIKAHKVLEGTKIGDSIAVNGVCLTVTRLQHDGFTADVMAETLRRTNLGQLPIGGVARRSTSNGPCRSAAAWEVISSAAILTAPVRSGLSGKKEMPYGLRLQLLHPFWI